MDFGFLFLTRLEDDDLKVKEAALVFFKKDGRKEKYSWGDYGKKAVAIAEGLIKSGVKEGDFVAIIPLNLPESFFALMGVILAGAVPVPLNVPLLKERNQKELKEILNDCRPKLILINRRLDCHLNKTELAPVKVFGIENVLALGESHLRKKCPENSHPVCRLTQKYDYLRLAPYDFLYRIKQENELLIMPYTSGTTGRPKGVMLLQKNILNRVEAVTEALNAGKDERVLSYLSLGHISDLIATFFGQLYGGYRVYFTEYAADILHDREKIKQNFPKVLRQTKPTIFLAVPKVWMNFRTEIERKIKRLPAPRWLKGWLVRRTLGFGQTRHFISAGSKISQNDKDFFSGLGIKISDIYGQTETGGPLTIDGKVIGKNTTVITALGEEICVSGDSVMLGYYNSPETNDEAFGRQTLILGEKTHKIFRTGDFGEWRNGKIFYAGRGDGFKLAQGEFVTPAQFEALEGQIKEIDSQIDEVLVCGDGKPYLVALVFLHNYSPAITQKITRQLPKIGEGLLKIGKFALLNSNNLLLTPTMKVKRDKMLKKYEHLIEHL